MSMRLVIRNNERVGNLFLFYLEEMFIHPGFQLFPCFVIVTKITRRTRNKIDTTPALGRNSISRKGEFNFVSMFKGDFETKS